MKVLKWADITVQQYLDIYRLADDKSLDDMGKVEKAICILYDITEAQLNEMPMTAFGVMCKNVSFVLTSPIPEKPVSKIKVNGRKYKIIYDPTKLKHRQYVELMSYGTKPIENMHLIMASVVQPVKWGIAKSNDVKQHEAIAADMLQAKVMDVHNACVFFCKLYISLIDAIRPYLVKQMTDTKKITESKANELVTVSTNVMAGFIQQKNWQSLKV